jgi:PAS domain S-box-containing protein
MNHDTHPLPAPPAPADTSSKPPRRAKRRVVVHSLAWIVLAISLAASMGGWFIARKHDELGARKRFDEEIGRIQMALSERMAIYQDVLHGAQGLYAASASVERLEWKAYVETISVNQRLPGMDGLGFIAWVPQENLEAFLRKTRADKSPDFQLKNPGTNGDYFITTYLEPESEHAALIGVDAGADPERRRAAEKARDTGSAVISSRLNLQMPGSEAEGGLMLMLPIFRNGAPTETMEERRANIVGWVYAQFITSRLMTAILQDKASLLRFEVFDRVGPGTETLVFDSDPVVRDPSKLRPPRFTVMDSLAVGQHLWLLRFSSKPAFNSVIPRSSELLVATGGGVICLLLFGIALSLSTTRERAMAMAAEMTQAFREANDRLQKGIEDRQRMERRAAVQHAVTRVLADSETLAEATPKIIQAICQSLAWDVGAIWRIDPQLKRLHCVEFWQRPGMEAAEFAAATRQRTFKPGEGLPGRVWATAQPAWIADVARDQNFPRRPVAVSAGLHAAFAFPIVMGGSFLGVMEFFSHQIVEPDAEVLQLVAALGSQIGQFIERKRTQEELQREQYLFAALMENLPDRIYFKDRQSRFLRVNRAMISRHGFTDATKIVGKTDFDLFTEEHARQAFEDEQRLIQSGQPVNKEEKETWPDGSVTWALSTKMPLRDETGKIVGTYGISRDITDRRRAEEAMRRARDEAEEANRTKSQFLASMSHELRTPLNSVIGFAGILLKNKTNNLRPADLNFLERIQANGKHLLVLINEILDLSKIEARKVELQMAPVALDVLVRETIAQQEGLVRDRPVKLLADVPATVMPLQADADKLRQVIINLIGNALKFTEHGSVTVRVVTDPSNNQPVRIEVADTGIGIPKDKLGAIFEAFQQADASTARKYGGTGLGLTISQALCQLMGFRIEVTSEIGRGSTFSITLGGKHEAALPPVPDSSWASPSTGEPLNQMSSDMRGKLVLVIDDESDSRILLTNLLEEFGCQVIAANSGAQGLRMAREFRPQLITVDLLMPQMDGASVIRALKADPQLSTIPLVVVSIVAEERRGSILGAVDILEKPVVRDELLAALQRNLLPARPKILIVDDEEDARRILLSHLAEEPVEVRTAANGRDALDMLESFPPDLILLDLVMPVMDGVAFLDTLRADPRHQQLPVIVITSKELSAAEREQLRQQALEVVKKTELSEEKFKQLFQRIFKQAEAGRQKTPVAG